MSHTVTPRGRPLSALGHRALLGALVVMVLLLGSGCFMSHERVAEPLAPCPEGDFPVELPPEREVLYVLSSAAGPRDGSMGRPFVSIGQALAVASRGSIVAIGKGTYDEEIRLGDGITLWGACREETVLTSSIPSDDRAVVQVEGTDTAIRNLTIRASLRSGVIARGPGRAAQLRDVHILGGQPFGLLSGDGAALELSRFQISGAVCGVALAAGAEVDLSLGLVSECDVGVCTGCGTEGYDFERLSDRVRYVDNGANYTVAGLPIPGSAPPCADL